MSQQPRLKLASQICGAVTIKNVKLDTTALSWKEWKLLCWNLIPFFNSFCTSTCWRLAFASVGRSFISSARSLFIIVAPLLINLNLFIHLNYTFTHRGEEKAAVHWVRVKELSAESSPKLTWTAMGLRADSARPQRVSGSARTDSQRAESARNPIAALSAIRRFGAIFART